MVSVNTAATMFEMEDASDGFSSSQEEQYGSSLSFSFSMAECLFGSDVSSLEPSTTCSNDGFLYETDEVPSVIDCPENPETLENSSRPKPKASLHTLSVDVRLTSVKSKPKCIKRLLEKDTELGIQILTRTATKPIKAKHWASTPIQRKPAKEEENIQMPIWTRSPRSPAIEDELLLPDVADFHCPLLEFQCPLQAALMESSDDLPRKCGIPPAKTPCTSAKPIARKPSKVFPVDPSPVKLATKFRMRRKLLRQTPVQAKAALQFVRKSDPAAALPQVATVAAAPVRKIVLKPIPAKRILKRLDPLLVPDLKKTFWRI